MNSFALWFESADQNDSEFIADVHFNLWNLHYKKAKPPFLDVGIKVYEPQKYSKVHFYVPWIVNKEEVVDLGQYLKSAEMLCTIFNDDFVLSQEPQSKIITALNSNSKQEINIYCLDIDSDVSIEHSYGGTIISFSRPDSLNGESTEYYRFRLTSEHFSRIIKPYSPKNVFLQSAFSTTEAIDFRFNDYRSLSPSLLEVMRNNASYKIGKVHFLLVVEADVDLMYASTVPTARELEKDTWSKYFAYLGGKQVVAYHWRVKSDDSSRLIENCIMFVKTRVHTCNWQTIATYIAIAGTLAVGFNYLSHLLF